MSQLTIYHNPRCSKSRATLALLEERNVHPEVIHYLETPPDAATLRRLLELLKLEPRQLMRTKEEIYQTLNLQDEDRTTEELIAAMVANPILIERPIVVSGKSAVIGRPPENVLSLL